MTLACVACGSGSAGLASPGSSSGGASAGSLANLGGTSSAGASTAGGGSSGGVQGGSPSIGGVTGLAGTGGAASAGSSAGGQASYAGSGGQSSNAGSGGSGISRLDHVFVLTFENHDASSVIGNTSDAPYLNGLLAKGSGASNFTDELPLAVLSEPHYVWMEAGSNAFADHTFSDDSDPSASNSTAETQHLATQLSAAQISWMSYQEGLNATTGACPIAPYGDYAPKHDPFVFFRDVAGMPPSKTNTSCAAHHKPFNRFSSDLLGEMAAYNFITPDLCHDMHGATDCPDSNTIRAGDSWLYENLPRLLDYLNGHAGVLFITWDEGENTATLPFLALGPAVKAGYVSTKSYTHSSLLKTIELILGVPVLGRVKDANDFSDMFTARPY